jgi:hypothetical protein
MVEGGMKLKFEPVYGYGWRSVGNELLDTPPPFLLEGSSTGSIIVGTVVDIGHPLSGLYVELTPRHGNHYNARVFKHRSADGEPDITGFATAIP